MADKKPDPYAQFDETAPKSTSATEAFLRGGGQGATLGLQSKLTGGLEALQELVAPTHPDQQKMSLSERLSHLYQNYKDARDVQNAYNQTAATEHPIAYTGGAITGNIPLMIATRGAVNPRTAAVLGGVQGAANVSNMPDAGVGSTVLGGGLGAVLGYGGTAIGNKVAPYLTEKLGQLSDKAYELVQKDVVQKLFPGKALVDLTEHQQQAVADQVDKHLSNVMSGVPSAILGQGAKMGVGAGVGSVVAPVFGQTPQQGAMEGAALFGLPGARNFPSVLTDQAALIAARQGAGGMPWLTSGLTGQVPRAFGTGTMEQTVPQIPMIGDRLRNLAEQPQGPGPRKPVPPVDPYAQFD